MYGFFEFFAGGGMARAGLGPGWRCLFANDFDPKKGRSYVENWGDGSFALGDVGRMSASGIRGHANLVWASFPCQDLSLAGGGAGLGGRRSGAFWPFWSLVEDLIAEGRAPDVIALENVCGALSSHGGGDFAAICAAFKKSGYNTGAFVIDAELFVPQSRPRLFIIGARKDLAIPGVLVSPVPLAPWHNRALRTARDRLAAPIRENWIWWRFPEPAKRNVRFIDIIEDPPKSVEWHSREETGALLTMMNDRNRSKVERAAASAGKCVGTLYKRTRRDANGRKVQCAEVRFDDIAGCLRTPAGGSSRQLIMAVEGGKIRSRLISSRETARLMGLPDEYKLPANYNEAYHLTGDGVVVPVVRHIANYVIEPLLNSASGSTRAVA